MRLILAAISVLGATLVVAGGVAHADPSCTLYWTGAADNDWTNAANWSDTDGGTTAGSTPGPSDIACMSTVPKRPDVRLGTVPTTVTGIVFAKTATVTPSLTLGTALTVGSADATIADLAVQNNAALSGAFTVGNMIETTRPNLAAGSLTITGNAALPNGLQFGAGYSLTNEGSITQCGGLSGTTGAPASVENDATMSCIYGGFSNVSVVNGTGAILTLGSASSQTTGYTVSNLVNYGALRLVNANLDGTVTSTGSIDLGAGQLNLRGGDVDVAPGEFTGTGTLWLFGGTLHGTGGTVSRLEIVGGAISGAISTGNLRIGGSNGAPAVTLSGPGTLTILRTQFTSYNYLGLTTLAGGFRLINDGEHTTSCALITLRTGAVFDNQGNMTVGCGGHGSTFDGDGTGAVVNEHGATLPVCGTVNEPVTNDGTLKTGCSDVTLPTLTNLQSGVLSGGAYNVGGTLTLAEPITTNEANVKLSGTGQIRTPSGDDALSELATNAGTFTTYSGTRVLPGLRMNSGALDVESGTLQLPSLSQTDGTVDVAPGAILRAGPFGDQDIDIDGGTITGNGEIDATLTVGGTIARGNATAPLAVAGPFTLESTASCRLALNPQTPTGSTALISAQQASLGGTLTVNSDNFVPAVGTTYTLLSAPGGIQGQFATVVSHLGLGRAGTISYTSSAVILTVSAAPLVSVSAGSLSAPEGDHGTSVLTIPVTLSAATSNTIAVRYSTNDGTATAGADYRTTSGKLTFAPGQTSQTVAVKIYGDTTYEPDETFDLTLFSPTDATIGSSGVETIVNDDAPPVPTVTAIAPGTIGQNATGVVVTVTGTNFLPTALVGFGTSDITVVSQSVQSATSIVATLSTSATAVIGSRDVRVRNPGAAVGVCAGCFAVDARPAPQQLSGSLGAGAQQRPLTLTGHGFGPGATVSITGGPTATATYVSATELTLSVTVPASVPPGSYTVRVLNTDGGYGGCAGCLVVTAGPTFTAINPASVARGTTAGVTITGTGFVTGARITGSAGVTFSHIAVVSPSMITATISVAATAAAGVNKVVRVTDPASAGWGSAALAALTIT